MDVILHLGAHRTASTSFQHYMRENATENSAAGLTFWGPWRTRNGLLSGIIPRPGLRSAEAQLERARGRIAMRLNLARARGIKQIVVSDENMIGAPRRNLRDYRLYGNIGERMARFNTAFGGQVTRIVLSMRDQDSYWGSALAYGVARGHGLPDRDELERIATGNRAWRDVIADLARAMPDAGIMIQPYENFGSKPEAKLAAMIGRADVPRGHARAWLNRAPDLPQLRQVLRDRGTCVDNFPGGEGRWQPFNRDQIAALREAYADDLYWLRAGADGLAILTEETGLVKEGHNPPAGAMTKGQTDGNEDRKMA